VSGVKLGKRAVVAESSSSTGSSKLCWPRCHARVRATCMTPRRSINRMAALPSGGEAECQRNVCDSAGAHRGHQSCPESHLISHAHSGPCDPAEHCALHCIYARCSACAGVPSEALHCWCGKSSLHVYHNSQPVHPSDQEHSLPLFAMGAVSAMEVCL
jgi:hypothetical protein